MEAVDRVHLEIEIVERVKSVERRLRSIEQSGNQTTLNFHQTCKVYVYAIK